MRNIIRTELLAPAGRWDALRAAVQNGADAVYIGEQSFSARKNANNFTWEEIENAVKYCHVRGVKVHLALNTLIADGELRLFEDAVRKATLAGVDALIIQDLGGARIAQRVCPDMPLHASTQLTACNLCDVKELQKLGFSRVVLSRELSQNEIRHIHENTDVELEAFVHGALCISFSGKCLMSSFIGGRSGNRGMCAQPCRQKYTADNKEGYFLSPRDLCLADEIKNMIEAGITSFKIEGRMKSPEYVATVTGVYRKYLDNLSALSGEDEKRLQRIFVRGDGFTKGYFSGKNTPEIMNYSLSNDNLSSRADEEILKEARETFREGKENKKIPVDAHLCLRYGDSSTLTLSDGEKTVTVCGDTGETAKNLPITEERARAQIEKLGQTPFVLRDFTMDAKENITLPVSALNALRRDGAAALAEKREHTDPLPLYPYEYKDKKCNLEKAHYVAVQVRTKEQFKGAKNADRILIPLSLWRDIVPDERCFVLLPSVVLDEQKTEEELNKIPANYGIYASSPGMLALAKKQGRRVFADYGANIYNSETAEVYGAICDGITLSPELSLGQICHITTHTDSLCEVLCHGYQAVMTSRACLMRGIRGKCDCDKNVVIKDKTGAEFTLLGDKDSHINTVLNSHITFMADKLTDVLKAGVSGIRLTFWTETAEETARIIAMYKGKSPIKKPSVFTRGYFMK